MNEDTTMRQTPFDLEQMIAAENDPQRRVLLLLVNTFNVNLAANTHAVESLSTKLDDHLTNFEQHMALGVGAQLPVNQHGGRVSAVNAFAAHDAGPSAG